MRSTKATSFAHLLMPQEDWWKSRYGVSLEGWAAVDKVARFSQSVGHVSGGRGSATLISLLDSRDQLKDSSSFERAEYAAKAAEWSQDTTRIRAGSPGIQHLQRKGKDGSSAANSSEAAKDGGPRVLSSGGRRSADAPLSENPGVLGVLLTTSHVLGSLNDIQDVTVRFLDRPKMGTVTMVGQATGQVNVRLCPSLGFVSSVSKRSRRRAELYHQDMAMHAAPSPSEGPTATLPHHHVRCADAATVYSEEEEEDVEEIGFTLTYCEVFDIAADATHVTDAASLSSQSHSPRGHNESRTGSVRLPGGAAVAFNSSSPSSGGESTPRATQSPRVVPAGKDSGRRGSLLQVQTLPVPLLLSQIPKVRVGDAHLMITHVDGGPQSYQVQRVAEVFDDFCVYEPGNLSWTTCSGGPVFNTHGDFIGVQHAKHGRSICLSIASIVRHLFDSDLLGMCRSPISGTSAAKEVVSSAFFRERPTSPPSALRLPALPGLGTSSKPRRQGFPSDIPKAAGATRGCGSAGSQSIRFPPCGRKTPSPAHCGDDVEALSRSPTPADPRIQDARARGGGAVTVVGRQRPGSNDAPHAQDACAMFGLTTPAAVSSAPHVPCYDQVFTEYYSGSDSLPHILYAFPHCLPLVKLATEYLSQLKHEDELEQMAAMGGIGAILETVDGYPQEEQIVAGSLTALCRVCLYESNVAMFVHLDGVDTVMEVMKEYTHHTTILQWGVYILRCVTERFFSSAAASTEVVIHCSGPQLLVNILRVHGAVSANYEVWHSQYSRLVHWTCDLLSNLLFTQPSLSTLLLHEDFLNLLLQLAQDYAQSSFLMEAIGNVFSAFVLCFADFDTLMPPCILPTGSLSMGKRSAFSDVSDAVSTSLSRGLMDSSVGFVDQSIAGVDHEDSYGASGARPYLMGSSPAPSTQAPSLPGADFITSAADPKKISFFFLCDAIRRDTDGSLLRSVLDLCDFTMSLKGSLTDHLGSPETVLGNCMETLRLLLIWGLWWSPAAWPHNNNRPLSRGAAPLLSMRSSPFLGGSLTADTVRLLRICKDLRRSMSSVKALMAKVEAVESLLLRSGEHENRW